MADAIIEQLDSETVRVTESVSKVTEYDITALQKQRARLVNLTEIFTTQKKAEIAEIDRILNLISGQ